MLYQLSYAHQRVVFKILPHFAGGLAFEMGLDFRVAGGRALEVVLNLRVPDPLISKGPGLESTPSSNTLHVMQVYRDIALGRRANASAAPTSESNDI